MTPCLKAPPRGKFPFSCSLRVHPHLITEHQQKKKKADSLVNQSGLVNPRRRLPSGGATSFATADRHNDSASRSKEAGAIVDPPPCKVEKSRDHLHQWLGGSDDELGN
jgi:hypothetical protein